MNRVAGRMLAAAASADRAADALERWAPGRYRLRLAGLGLKAMAAELVGSAAGWRRATPGGLEAAAVDVLAGAQVTPCATGHEWPAAVTVDIIGRRRPETVCADCALTLLDAGLLASMRKGQ